MNFSEQFKPYRHWKLQISDNSYINLVPERGGIITEWINQGEDILYFDEDRFKDSAKSIRGGIPILFPICGELQSDNLVFKNSSEQMLQHGFARNNPWQMNIKEDNEIELLFTDNESTRLYYPFEFAILIQVFLEINRLSFKIKIINNSISEMPFNFGIHPYFRISDFSNISLLNLPNKVIDQTNSSKVLTSKLLTRLSRGVDFIANSSEITSIYDNIFNRKITLYNKYPFDFTVFWTNPPRKMICMEPWTSPRNSLTSGIRRIDLKPFQEINLECSIFIEKVDLLNI
tara:strand:+ start:6805 stop:7668 length:864 start_codon:yes stop_codon:yes gene_type:complete